MSRKGSSLSEAGKPTVSRYETYLRTEVDLRPATIRNYLADVMLFAVWCETTWGDGVEVGEAFSPANVVTPTITQYRSYLQTVAKLKPATINRALISIRRYLDWAVDAELINRNPAKPVKPVPRTAQPAHQLTDKEESALLRAVDEVNSLRDRALIILMLHAGLRVGEVRTLKCEQIELGKNSGGIEVIGKRNKYRYVPLNATARSVLREYMVALPPNTIHLFPSEKTGEALGERMVQIIVKKYAEMAKIKDLSPHDLRHRFGYRLAESNTPIHRIAQIMGHDSYNTTMIYIKGTEADLQMAVEKLTYE
jgi:integrase/recombinase XerD